MKAPRRTHKITEGLLVLADAAERKGAASVLGRRVRTKQDRSEWNAVLRAIDWIRDLRVYDFAERGITYNSDDPGACLDGT
jgi:hypothetical protein